MLEAVQTNPISSHERELTVTLKSDIVHEEYNHTLNHIQSIASRPGFRKGKMPKNMVESFYGKQIKDELIEKLIDKSFETACQKELLTPVSRPKVSIVGDLNPRSSFTYKAVFQIKPKITEVEHSGLNIEMTKVAVSDEDIKFKLEKLQESHAIFTDVLDRDVIGPDDVVYADISFKLDGAIVKDSQRFDQAFPLFETDVSQPLREILLGKKVGDDVTIDYALLKGADAIDSDKPLELFLTITSFKERKLPNIDDEFAKDISEKFANLFELKNALHEKLSEIAQTRNKILREDAIVKALVLKNPFDVPPALVDNKALSMISDLFLRNMSKEEAETALRKHYQDMRKVVDERAVNYVKAQLLFEYLANKLSVSVDESLVENKMQGGDFEREDAIFSLQIEELFNIIEKAANVTIIEKSLVSEDGAA